MKAWGRRRRANRRLGMALLVEYGSAVRATDDVARQDVETFDEAAEHEADCRRRLVEWITENA